MRILLALHNAFTDCVSGAARSTRTHVAWLAEAGHEVRVLCSARFDAAPPESVLAHLASLGLATRAALTPRAVAAHLRRNWPRRRPAAALVFRWREIPVTLLLTRHHDPTVPDRLEYEQLVLHCDAALDGFQPDLVISYGGHPVVREYLRRAQARGCVTLFKVHNYGFDDPRWFEPATGVLMPSEFLARRYRDRIGIAATGIPTPVEWREVLAPAEESRRFVTFVNPSPHKGVTLFARLAAMLGERRPDIAVMVVQSAADARLLAGGLGIDFTRYPQIVAAPPVPAPRDFLSLSRILLVPSVFDEPHGRVAVEAMINGIPPLVSERGALPETVGPGGTVIPLPSWMTPDSLRLPSEAETASWFDAVCKLWDDPAHYRDAAARARAEADARYAEAPLKGRHLEYIDALVGRRH